MITLFDRDVAGRRVTVVATERADGDMHPRHADPVVLERRQHAVVGARWSVAAQEHGTEVVPSSAESDWPLSGTGDVVVAADGHAAVWAADCAPLLLIGANGTLVGCHGGWRGLALGVVDVAVAALDTDETVAAAVLGPVIGPCCYEFGAADLDEVAAGVGAPTSAVVGRTSTGARALDVPAAVAAALALHAIDLDVVGPCTGCDDRWFSHRVRGDAGRHCVVGWTAPSGADKMHA